MYKVNQIESRVLAFANDYEHQKQRVMKALWSCKNIPQLESAENFFKVLKNYWSEAIQVNSTIKLLVETDEEKFYREFNSMYAEFRYL